MTEAMDDNVRAYVEGIAAEHRPLFDRLYRLALEARPGATVVISYDIPTFKVGRRRFFVAAWRHGVSLYGWQAGRDGGFVSRHPELLSGRATIRLRPQDAAAISDDEFRELARAALAGD
ncbi:MAG TPA: DUF1801 domain-containing protein [Actinocrinis sp.]|nr:DUF1801 domain-containing protein [Actinocrinis sp.]